MKKTKKTTSKIAVKQASEVNLNTSTAKKAYDYVEKMNKLIIETPKIDDRKLNWSLSI